MFLFRWISNFLALMGFVLAGLLTFWAFKPLEVSAKAGVNLSQILNCTETPVLTKVDEILQRDIDLIKSATGDTVPVEMFNDLAKNIGSITQKTGTKPKMSVSYCTLDKNTESINTISSYFAANNKDYAYGSLEQVVKTLNGLPYVEILNIDAKVPTTLVRTKACNKPVNQSDFYFFASVGDKNIVMFQINLEKDPATTAFSQKVGNLIQSGQYIKHKLYCNE